MTARLVRVSVVSVEEAGGQQLVRARGLAGEEFDRLVRIEPNGFASRPPMGAEGVALVLGRGRDQAMILGLEAPSKRPTGLGDGDAVLYHPDGRRIHFTAAGTVMDFGNLDVSIAGLPVLVFDGPIVLQAPEVRLGPGPDYSPVVTLAGPSSTVFASVP